MDDKDTFFSIITDSATSYGIFIRVLNDNPGPVIRDSIVVTERILVGLYDKNPGAVYAEDKAI